MTTGERIRMRRKELKISADELAEKIGVSRSTVFRYENGYIEKLPINNLVPLAAALDTTPEFLMGWDDSDSTSRFLGVYQHRLSELMGSVSKADMEAAGLDQLKVSDMIEGRRDLTFKELSDLADALDMSMDDLLLILLGGAAGEKEKPTTISDDGSMDQWDELTQLLRQVPEEQQEMLYNMIEAALKSYGLME